MIIELDLQDALAAGELLAIQRLAYRQEAELIGYPDLPPLRESLPALMDCGEAVLAWRLNGVLMGALGYRIAQDASIDICRLVVAPAAQRQGIGRALVKALIEQFPRRSIMVSTALRNYPAVALYESLGFVVHGDHSTPDGLALVDLVRAGHR